ncbi:alpha/beta hydrolase-fold protein [Streptomyces sp. NPDC001250]|uniref:alpha/beta hydrolase-fold protein n=1 Tax=unclassified Streptomyces TaxID=2593676 RepID=UPI00332B5A66
MSGRRNETYLAVDVPAQLVAHYQVSNAPRSWAAMGYSTGGFCAANVAFHHPARYAAAAALSGSSAQSPTPPPGTCTGAGAACGSGTTRSGRPHTGTSTCPCTSWRDGPTPRHSVPSGI